MPGFVLIRTAASCISAGTEMATVTSSGESIVEKARRKPELIKRGIDMVLTRGIKATLETVRGKLDAGSPSGYSLAGEVIEAGAGIDDIKPGQRVAAAGAAYANHAEVVCVPRNLVVPIPEGVTYEHAAAVTLGAISMQGVRRAVPTFGESAAIIGLGLLGQITVQILKAAGARVIGFDLDPVRVSEAKGVGCDMAINAGTTDPVMEAHKFSGGPGVDFVIITAATSAHGPINQAMDMCRKKGRVVIVGDVGLSMDRNKLYAKELDVLISTSYGPGRYDQSYEEYGNDYPIGYVRWTENRNMQEFLRLIAEKKIDLSPLISNSYPLEGAARAYEALADEENRPLLVVLTYPEEARADVLQRTITIDKNPAPKKEGILNVGIIGAGNFATAVHLPNLQKLEDRYTIHTICDIHSPTALSAATRFKSIKHSSDAEEICKDPEIDVVFITTRHDQHAPLTRLAAGNGKAVFCEKPMGVTREETLALAKLLKETETPYLVGFNRRFSPAAQKIRELTEDRNHPILINYTVNAGFLDGEHWAHGAAGGGRIVGEGCHMIDVCSFLTGSTLADLKANAIKPGDHRYYQHDNVQMSLTYEDGSVAQITYTALGAPQHPKERVEVYAGGWVFTIDDYKRLVILGPASKVIDYKATEKCHLEELISFSKWMRGEAGPPIELACMLETTLATFAAYEQIGFSV
jgi:predicted dehydrogenase/threonine dehydrogenase-like Zn-dependent dehydrogenase